MRVMSVVGARPQFIKAAAVSQALRAVGCREDLVHTGQHYDTKMSDIFFAELGMAEPVVNLGVGSSSHGRQTAEMLTGIESAILELSPDLVLVYGDTNSTLAGAVAAVKLQVPVAHVEAGARNFSLCVPEEVNRVLTDRVSALRFCTTKTNVDNLRREGIEAGVILSGDVMLDIFIRCQPAARHRTALLAQMGLRAGEYVLATFHRPPNVDRPDSLRQILLGLSQCGHDVVFPVHPRTRQALHRLAPDDGIRLLSSIKLIDPVGYLDLLCLEIFCQCVVTDSGGVQREAYFAGKPCVTVFPNTAWPETVQEGWNRMVSPKAEDIASAIRCSRSPGGPRSAFGDGTAAAVVAQSIRSSLEAGITVDGDCIRLS